ncbi:hypothetical protein [Winogradskyella jejuensis]|uniref:Uncharacterized protein n=1 Tax=Winogradskyella jejuensis TaxID=1089305 RepID=A0A1M5KM19_9FLAO|nr:hypothetical protein [Winogradskyella jejuensis]SHG53828.1 hypothetical protein SAMN05444148_0374 [Winogradskyella jejuensis]
MEETKINEILISLGFGLPQSPDEIKAFDDTFKSCKTESNPEKIDSYKILEDLRPKKKATNIDYHKRTVLAAEIVYQLYQENTLGHLKLQKLLYLCQNSARIDIHANFLKQAMGPYDNRLMRSIDKKFKENKWFSYNPREYEKYQPLENCGGHKEWYERYFNQQLSEIDFIITKFRKTKTRAIELIATIFACWKEVIDEKQLLTDEILVYKFYQWHPDKSKFNKDEILQTIAFMKNDGFHPNQQ